MAGRLPQLTSFVAGQALSAGAHARLATGAVHRLIDPARATPACEYGVTGPHGVGSALAACAEAQLEWRARTGTERAAVLRRAAGLLRQHNEELARLEALDTGRPIAETMVVDVVSAADCLDYVSAVAQTLAGRHVEMPGGSFGYTRREPLGVCAGIGAWNYPLQGAAFKGGPALAFGNGMVFKPAEDTPRTALRFAELLAEAGLPDGLFSVVLGDATTGQLLTQHPGVAKVSLTGEASTGRLVYSQAAQQLKHVTLELGGKSPLIIFPDADVDEAVSGAMMANFYSNGEVCSNAARVFVHPSIRAPFLERLAARTARMRCGDPLDPEVDMGPLITRQHLDKVQGYVDSLVRDGATLVCGGGPPAQLRGADPEALRAGHFFAPTVFADCRDDMTGVREEIFGPVMTVLDFESEDEVVERCNATEYGLAAGLFTRDLARAHRVIAQLEAGTCYINNYNLAPVELPFGGFKQSGLGRENGINIAHFWTQEKSVFVELGPVDCPYR